MNDSPFDKQLEMADNFYREKNNDKAFKHYEKALTFFPYHEYCMTQIVRTLYRKSIFLKSKGKILVDIPDTENCFKTMNIATIWEDHLFYFNRFSFPYW